MPRELEYAAVLTAQPSGGYAVSCPDLPELLTEGATRSEAVREAVDALEEVIAGRVRRGEDVPEPKIPTDEADVAWVRVPPIMAAKAALALALLEAGLTRSGFVRQLGVDEKEVRRLLDPRHASKLARLEEALLLLGQRVELRCSRGRAPRSASR